MRSRSRRRAALSAASLLFAFAVGARLRAGTAPPPRTGFSGSWGLTEQTVSDPAAAADNPLEALGDARRIVVVDDGTRVEITYPSGRKRVVITDGEEREQDDGDGPSKVMARRKSAPERVLVTSKWSAGHSLKETWELLASPRRLVVAGKVDGRHTLSYRRVFEPVPDLPPTPTPAPTAASAPAAPPGPASAPPSAPGVRPECSLRPASGLSPSELKRLVKVSSRGSPATGRRVRRAAAGHVGDVVRPRSERGLPRLAARPPDRGEVRRPRGPDRRGRRQGPLVDVRGLELARRDADGRLGLRMIPRCRTTNGGGRRRRPCRGRSIRPFPGRRRSRPRSTPTRAG